MTRPIPLAPAALPLAARRIPGRIRFNECDPAGIVFFANWFMLTNVALEDFFALELQVDYHALHDIRRIGTGYAHAAADFFAPARMGEPIQITPLVTRIGGASYALTVHIHRDEAELVRLHLVTATTDMDRQRAIPIPDDLRAALATYQARCALAGA